MDNIEADLKEIIKSDGCNEMQFNESKIQLLTYGKIHHITFALQIWILRMLKDIELNYEVYLLQKRLARFLLSINGKC